ncbi:MAG: single-stranded DNA-binding protein [Chloroflexi bacterium]|nr:single-stranded DNA-binding protein [Chloroflexota bacterium]
MYQKMVIAGNLGRDPEMRYTPSGQAVTNLNVATNRQYTSNSGEKVKETTWFRVSVWGKQAESCNQYLRKGSKVLVEGRMNQDPATGGPRVWTGNDGSPRASFEITAQTVRFLSSRGEDQAAGGGGQSSGSGSDYGQGSNNMMPPPDDDIPF